MSSKFSTSQSRAQHTPKVCISKQREAAHVVVPTWQRAVIGLDLAAASNCTGLDISETIWLTRSGPNDAWVYDQTNSQGVRIQINIAEPVTFELTDIAINLFPPPPPPGQPPCSFAASCPRDAWSNTLYGGRSPLIAPDGSQAGIVSVRFEGQAPQLA